MNGLLYVSARTFCCGLHVVNDKVVEAAPIMAWAVGMHWQHVEAWLHRKGATFEVVRP